MEFQVGDEIDVHIASGTANSEIELFELTGGRHGYDVGPSTRSRW